MSYLLLVHISRMFSSMPGLADGIARDIREGALKQVLLQPIDMIAYLLSYRVAHKSAYIVTASLPYARCSFSCAGLIHRAGPRSPTLTLAAYLAVAAAGLPGRLLFRGLHRHGRVLVPGGQLALYVVNTLNFFVSGQMFPLDLLPPFWAGAAQGCRFSTWPTSRRRSSWEDRGHRLVLPGLGEVAWAMLFSACRAGSTLGLRRYSAYGG